MERWFIRWPMKPLWAIAALIAGLLTVACGGGGGSPGANPNTGALSVGGVSAVTVLPGESKLLPVTGGVPPYRAVTSEAAVAVAAMDGNSLVVGGIAPGASTNVIVTDYAGTSKTVSVTVGTSVPLYTTAPAALTIGVGSSQARTFRVSGGVKPYTITGSAPLVATVTQLDAEQWSIQGVAIGDMKVRIRDAAGKELEVAVTVGSPQLRISPTNASTVIGLPTRVFLSGGQPPYQRAGGILAGVTVTAVTNSPNQFDVVGNLVGEYEVGFVDSAGQSVKLDLAVGEGSAQFRISPSDVSVVEDTTTPITFRIWGATPNTTEPLLTVFSSSPALFPAPPVRREGDALFFTVDSVGCVLANTDIKYTVIDANGSVGTATLRVINTGNNGTDPCPAN